MSFVSFIKHQVKEEFFSFLFNIAGLAIIIYGVFWKKSIPLSALSAEGFYRVIEIPLWSIGIVIVVLSLMYMVIKTLKR